jgi:hypothetical protein
VIHIDTVREAIATAQEFDRRGLVLCATPGTPLASLCQSAALCDATSNNETSYEPDAAYIAQQSEGWNPEQCSKHTDELGAMVSVIAKAVQGHLNFARSVVSPVVQALVKEVEEDIKALPVNLQYVLQIKVIDPAEPLLEPVFEEMIHAFKDISYMPIEGYLSLAEKSGSEVLELLGTGDKCCDDAIALWGSKTGDAFFQHVWDCVFTASPTKGRFNSLIADNATGTDAALTVFLLCKKLYDTPPEGTNLALPAYNEMVGRLRDQAALRLHHAYEEYARNSSTGLLIRSYSLTEVQVNGNVYRKWLEGGGNTAVLFGSVLSSRPSRFVSDLDEGAGQFLSTWEQHNFLLSTSERNKRFARYKEILHGRLLGVVGADLQNCFAHLRPGMPADTNMPEYLVFLKNADAFVDSVNESDFKNLWSLSLKAVCQSAFYYTGAESILGGIERACQCNAGIEVREAALLSLVDYVVDYVCDQMCLSGL